MADEMTKGHKRQVTCVLSEKTNMKPSKGLLTSKHIKRLESSGAACQKAFDALEDTNKLKKLTPDSKLLVYSHAVIYVRTRKTDTELSKAMKQQCAKARALVKVARDFSKQLGAIDEDGVLQIAKDAVPTLRLRHLLQAGATSIAKELEDVLNRANREGHEYAVFSSSLLSMATARIKEELGAFREGDFLELCQQIEPSASELIDAETLKKRRRRLERRYPEVAEFSKSAGKPKPQRQPVSDEH